MTIKMTITIFIKITNTIAFARSLLSHLLLMAVRDPNQRSENDNYNPAIMIMNKTLITITLGITIIFASSLLSHLLLMEVRDPNQRTEMTITTLHL